MVLSVIIIKICILKEKWTRFLIYISLEFCQMVKMFSEISYYILLKKFSFFVSVSVFDTTPTVPKILGTFLPQFPKDTII